MMNEGNLVTVLSSIYFGVILCRGSALGKEVELIDFAVNSLNESRE